MSNCLTQYYRCPESCGTSPPEALLEEKCTLAGKIAGASFPSMTHSLAIDYLRSEKYVSDWRDPSSISVLAKLYYAARPFLPVAVRKHLQRFYFRDWRDLSFPNWPVDCTVDDLHQQLLLLTLRASGAQRIPFIWFWPDGAPSCAIMTHDIETSAGRDLCGELMDIDDSYGIKSSFQVIPEQRYVASPAFLDSVRTRRFEIVIHDLNHDGHLYRDRKQFLERATRINAYGKLYGAQGFRAGSLYRKQVWYDALDFAYDMSVPNVAHLDPQRGGCCTVMPYFLGKILELPVTTSQDYTLFSILNDYSINLWKRQTGLILQNHGLMSFIAHPDYLSSVRRRNMYEELLVYLVGLRDANNVWIATPGEVNRWWRQRAEMKLVEDGQGWHINGPGCERGRIAYASEDNGHLVITLQAQPLRQLAMAAQRMTTTF